jgi:hypothetical protein
VGSYRDNCSFAKLPIVCLYLHPNSQRASDCKTEKEHRVNDVDLVDVAEWFSEDRLCNDA